MRAATTEIIARAVIRRDGQLLLARQRTKSWSFLPGGHVEPGERVEAALVRELAEELGTAAKVVGFLGAVEHGYVEDDVTHHEIYLVFEIYIDVAEPVSKEDHRIRAQHGWGCGKGFGMRDFFRRHGSATWGRQDRLHVYALPTEPLRRAVDQYHRALVGLAAEHGLGLQPRENVHFTVQMLHCYLDEMSQPQLDSLVERLRAELRSVEPITLQVGPPVPSTHAVELHVSPHADNEWRGLVSATRRAAGAALGDDALPALGPNAIPHASIGYGISRGDSGVLASALKQVRFPEIEVPVTEVHLLAVTQHPDKGRFTWDSVATIALGEREPVAPNAAK
ncbi:NUDIX domain-containing protein [Saccharopolyspora hattusasensis]|uniref:NUDIX domain-containing protein n=1 Tax=Saccharopolyspora hattusasensis TaxID=1128679 RepID=UPI003D95E0CB